jgi:hypothetical protein
MTLEQQGQSHSHIDKNTSINSNRNQLMPDDQYNKLSDQLVGAIAKIGEVAVTTSRLDERSLATHEVIVDLKNHVAAQNGRIRKLEKKWWIAFGATIIILMVAGFIGEKFWNHMTAVAGTQQQQTIKPKEE